MTDFNLCDVCVQARLIDKLPSSLGEKPSALNEAWREGRLKRLLEEGDQLNSRWTLDPRISPRSADPELGRHAGNDDKVDGDGSAQEVLSAEDVATGKKADGGSSSDEDLASMRNEMQNEFHMRWQRTGMTRGCELGFIENDLQLFSFVILNGCANLTHCTITGIPRRPPGQQEIKTAEPSRPPYRPPANQDFAAGNQTRLGLSSETPQLSSPAPLFPPVLVDYASPQEIVIDTPPKVRGRLIPRHSDRPGA
eukprot:751923-Hanusia_phi.AAC.1